GSRRGVETDDGIAVRLRDVDGANRRRSGRSPGAIGAGETKRIAARRRVDRALRTGARMACGSGTAIPDGESSVRHRRIAVGWDYESFIGFLSSTRAIARVFLGVRAAIQGDAGDAALLHRLPLDQNFGGNFEGPVVVPFELEPDRPADAGERGFF